MNTGEFHGTGCPHCPKDHGGVDPTLNPKAHPPDWSSEEFPVLKDAVPRLVNGRYSKRRRSFSQEEPLQSATHPVQQVKSGTADGLGKPQTKSWRDLIKEDRPHVVLSDAADDEDGLDDDDVIVEYGPDGPNLKFKDTFYEACVNSWRNVVIIKQLGARRPLGMLALYNRLLQIWPWVQGCSIIDHDNGYFSVRFHTDEDAMKTLVGGPWVVNRTYLHVQPWSQDFNDKVDTISSIVAWIRLPGMPPYIYHKKVFKKIGDIVGKVLKIDHQTATQTRGKFARLAVQLDLTKPLLTSFHIMGKPQLIEYENLPELCFSCGHYGHLGTVCPTRPSTANHTSQNDGVPDGGRRKPVVDPVENDEWIAAKQKDKRKVTASPRGSVAISSSRSNNDAEVGSRFEALQELTEEEVDGIEDIQMGKEVRVEGDIIFKADKGKGIIGSTKGRAMKPTGIHQNKVGRTIRNMGSTPTAGIGTGGTKGDSRGAEGAQIQTDKLVENDDSLNFLSSQGQTVVRAETALDPSKHRAVHVLDNHIFNNNNVSGPEGFEDEVNVDMMLDNLPKCAQKALLASSLTDQVDETSQGIMEADLDENVSDTCT
ncbi:Unknown protein [Striga hermonthica]|uniref:CCHC-type domain-containing protein n=1 Tax=Striga hermonthica TaxID=68872 RepID=A0A9N7R7G9_STRHE|nr:Unknown protein [Striga hermonthica]